MGREFELKYSATPEQLERIAANYPDFTAISMETTYYDTPDSVLSHRHWTLRRRMENGVSVCTLKTDLKEGGRGEWETECDDILKAVPALIAMGGPAELAELVKNGVAPSCGARFTRRAVKVSIGSSVVEIALDKGVLLGGGQELPLCETEVELKQGTDADAILFAKTLAAKYGLQEEHRSKLRRALRLAGKD